MKISVWDHYALIASHWAGLASDTAPTHHAVPSPLCLRALVCVSSVTLNLLSPVHPCSSISLETIQPHSCYCCCLVVCFVFIFIYLGQDLLYLGVTSWPQTHHVTMDNHGLFLVLQSLPLECWDCRHMLSFWIYEVLRMEHTALCMLGNTLPTQLHSPAPLPF